MTDYIEVKYSDDFGHNWSNWRRRDLGPTGAFNKRKVWRQLGITRNRIFKVRVTSFTRVDIIAASAQIDSAGQ